MSSCGRLKNILTVLPLHSQRSLGTSNHLLGAPVRTPYITNFTLADVLLAELSL